MFANMFPREMLPLWKSATSPWTSLNKPRGSQGEAAPSAGSAATATGSVWAFSWRPGKYHGRWWIPWFWGITWGNSFLGFATWPIFIKSPRPISNKISQGRKRTLFFAQNNHWVIRIVCPFGRQLACRKRLARAPPEAASKCGNLRMLGSCSIWIKKKNYTGIKHDFLQLRIWKSSH